jgi:hypothetical protein
MLSLASIAAAIAAIPGGGTAVAGAASALGYLLRCAGCLKVLGVLALIAWTAWHVHRADVEACEGRLEDQSKRAAAAGAQRDKDVATDLRKTFEPQIRQLADANRALQKRIDDAKRKPAAAAAARCKLGAAAGLVQPIPVR